VKIFVSIIDTKGKKSTFALRQKPIFIGRSAKSHVTISDELASSKHCSIYLSNKQVYIEDCGSKNGIYLNGIKVVKQRIYLDDKVKVGNSLLTFAKERLDPSIIKFLTPKGGGNRVNGEVSLQLDVESHQFNTTRAIKDKLYKGVHDSQKRLSLSPLQVRLLSLREILANIIDFTLASLLISVPFIAFYFYDKEGFQEVFLIEETHIKWEALGSYLGLILLGLSFLLCFVFNIINRKKMSVSIGERLLGLN
jgi:pSer/pThr/pTyr-binding forkhead associated (FHA) protein